MYDKIIAFDLETTGLKPLTDEIIEIAAICYCPVTKEVNTFQTLVMPDNPIPKHITKITGINNKTLTNEGAQPLKEAIRSFFNFILSNSANPLFVGHNIIKFDNNFINQATKKLKIEREISKRHSWDTLLQTKADRLSFRAGSWQNTQAAARYQKTTGKNDLANACYFYKVKPQTEKHRALPDAKNAIKVFIMQYRRNKWAILPARP